MENRPTQAESISGGGILSEVIHLGIKATFETTKQVAKESMPDELQEGIDAYAQLYKQLLPKVHQASEDSDELEKIRAELKELQGNTEGKKILLEENKPSDPIPSISISPEI